MQKEIIYVLIASCIFYLIAELIGRGKHIGRWWSFLLLLGGIIPGLIALLFSPSAKKNPTKGSYFHTVAGWIFIILLGAIPLFFTLFSIQTYLHFGIDIKYELGIPISNIINGIYLIQLGKGKIINRNPKIYFPNFIKNIIPDPIKISFNSDVNTEIFYYIIENNIQSEPISFEQLKEKKISEETLVWRNGLVDWTKAKNLKELKHIIFYTPPPIPLKEEINISSGVIEKTTDEIKKEKLSDNIVSSSEKATHIFIFGIITIPTLIWLIIKIFS